MEKYNLRELKDTIQDCNINFLIGSGASRPFLGTLGDIETALTKLNKKFKDEEISSDQYKIILASIYKYFFNIAIKDNVLILSEIFDDEDKEKDFIQTLDNYSLFLKIINQLMLLRKSSIIGKQINIFTSNYDIFLEKSLENLKFEFNDGFIGNYKKEFDTSNYKKSVYRTSTQYDNKSEIPIFNLFKLQGSLTWDYHDKSNKVLFSPSLKEVSDVISSSQITEKLFSIGDEIVDNKIVIENLIEKCNGLEINDDVEKFLEDYNQLSIVNPTKDKFKQTVLEENYYELLRFYSNELEKENTLLFVFGFSFADEHIRKITERSLNSNPTLKVIYFSFSSKIDDSVQRLEKQAKNLNFEVITPDKIKPEDSDYQLSLDNISKDIFEKILHSVKGKKKSFDDGDEK